MCRRGGAQEQGAQGVIDGLKPYPAMKDSGVPWLGEVPAHWEVKSLRTILTRVTKRNRPDLPLLSVVREKGVIRRESMSDDENHNFVPDDLSNYKVVRAGQFAMNKMKAWQGSYGVSTLDGIVSPAYFVFDVWGVGGAFFHTAIRSGAYVPALAQSSDGVRIGQWDLSEAGMRELKFALPPSAEQVSIVRFLDHADRRIRRYIRAKQKLIKLLEELKAAIIHRAVTRGLDANVRLKPSGVEWLGDVPEHWEVVRLGRLIELATGFPFKSDGFTQDAEDIRLLRGVNISPGKIRWMDVVRWPLSERDKYSAFELQVGDIVLGMDRPLIQSGTRVATISEPDVPALLLQRVARIRPRRELQGEFLALLFAGKSFAEYLTPIFTGISVPHLSPEQIKSFRLALPTHQEQRQIVRWAAEKTWEINAAVVSAEREIELLREYRTRLIADVVTGKLDVREAAARLPQEAEDLKLLDEAEVEVDAGDADAGNTDGMLEEAAA